MEKVNQIFIYIWLSILIASVIVEIMTTDLISIWFAPGALVAIFFCLSSKIPFWVSIIVFLVISFTCLASLRKIALKFLLKKKTNTATNTDLYIGQTYIVETSSDDKVLATCKINGVVWNVKEKNGKPLLVGDKIETISIEGSKFIVKKKEN